jgi:hypothetical protein
MTKGMSNVVLGRGSKVLEELMIGGEFCHLEFDKKKPKTPGAPPRAKTNGQEDKTFRRLHDGIWKVGRAF